MSRYYRATRVFRAAIVVLSVLAAGCGSGSGSGTTQQPVTTGASGIVNINPKVLLSNIGTATGNPLNIARSLGGWDWINFLSNFGTLLTNVTYTLDMQKVSYQSTGADGLQHTMTGLLILPRHISGARPAVPILMYQHGTEPYRLYSPSRFLTNQGRPADYPEVMVAAAIASTGYAVAMADYEGLGDNTDIQPFAHGNSLAQQVVGMLRASRDIITGTGSSCTWNSQLFLMGYSEGGYVTLATTRELQLNHAAEFTVTASAPLSGPHDLSGTMRTLILSNSTSKAPYFLPFLLTSYNYASGGNLFNPAGALISTLNTTVPPLFAGNTPSDQINVAMGMIYSNPPVLIVPRSVLVQSFIDQLSLTTSPLVAFLTQNDSYRNPANLTTAWKPTVPPSWRWNNSPRK